MTSKKDIITVIGALTLLVLGSIIIYYNFTNDESNVYIAFFQQFEKMPELKNAAFMSRVSDCEATPSHMAEASSHLFEAFYAANSVDAEPKDISKFSSMVNVVAWDDTIKFDRAGTSNFFNLNTDKHIIYISRIGFDDKKERALLCIETNHSASLYMFHKIGRGKWEIFKQRMMWIT